MTMMTGISQLALQASQMTFKCVKIRLAVLQPKPLTN